MREAKRKTPKWPIWKPARGPQASRRQVKNETVGMCLKVHGPDPLKTAMTLKAKSLTCRAQIQTLSKGKTNTSRGTFDGGDTHGRGTVFVSFLHDGPMSLAICIASPYCQANVAQLWFSLSKARGVAFHWQYGVCLLRAEAPVLPPHSKASQTRSWSALSSQNKCSPLQNKDEVIETPRGQHCPSYQLHFPQSAANGDPEVLKLRQVGKFGLSVEFPHSTPVRRTPGNSFWRPHFGDLRGFSGGIENGQSWYVRQGGSDPFLKQIWIRNILHSIRVWPSKEMLYLSPYPRPSTRYKKPADWWGHDWLRAYKYHARKERRLPFHHQQFMLSLGPYRSSSVRFFFLRGNLEGSLARLKRDFFGPTK